MAPLLCARCGREIKPGQYVDVLHAEAPDDGQRIFTDAEMLVSHVAGECEDDDRQPGELQPEHCGACGMDHAEGDCELDPANGWNASRIWEVWNALPDDVEPDDAVQAIVEALGDVDADEVRAVVFPPAFYEALNRDCGRVLLAITHLYEVWNGVGPSPDIRDESRAVAAMFGVDPIMDDDVLDDVWQTKCEGDEHDYLLAWAFAYRNAGRS